MSLTACVVAIVIGIFGLASSGLAQPTLRIVVPALPSTLDPHTPEFWAPNSPLPNLYETLLARDLRGRLIPSLASSWRPVEDGLVWEFTLRHDVRFQNGDLMDTAAVKFSLDRFLNAARSQPWGVAWRSVAGVQVVAPDAVRVRGANTAVLPELFAIGGAIVSPRPLADGTGQARARLAGTGPYTIVDIRAGQSMSIAMFPNYWGRHPQITKATFTVMPTPTDRVAEVRQNQAQIATDIGWNDLDLAGAKYLARAGRGAHSHLYAVASQLAWDPRSDERLLIGEFRVGGSKAAPSTPEVAVPRAQPGARSEEIQAPRSQEIQAPRSQGGGAVSKSVEAPVEVTPAPSAPPPTLGPPAAPPPARVYNAFFEEGGDANQQLHRLDPNRDYHLLFYIGEPSPQNILGHAPLNAFLRQRAAQGDSIDLDLVVICSFCSVSQTIQRRTVRLGTSGNTEAQRYVLTPIRSGDFELVLAVEFQHMTVQNFTLPVRVGTGATTSTVPMALSTGPLRSLPAPMLTSAGKIKAADLTITFVQRGDAQYRVDLVSSDGAIKLENGKSLLEDDLQQTLKGLWQRLRVLIKNKNDSVQFSKAEIDSAKFSAATRAAALLELARTGRALYNDLFRSDTAVLEKLREFRARPAAAEPPLVYIRTLGVFLPWAILYDGDPEELERGRVDLDGFWGYRYRLEGWLLDKEGRLVPDTLEPFPVRLLYGFYSSGADQVFVQRRKDQETFFRSFGQDLQLATVDSNQGLKTALTQMRKQIEIVYIYAHGNGGQKSVWADAAGTPVELWIPEPEKAAIALSPVPPPGGLVPRDFTDIFIGGEPLRLEASPIVFLNVCEGEGNAAISAKNFVSAFMTIGARAVIASDAEIWQNFAEDYGEELFRRMFDKGSANDLSRVMFNLRHLYLDRDNNPFPLLYTLWGHGEYKARQP